VPDAAVCGPRMHGYDARLRLMLTDIMRSSFLLW
jgi:hypothetical protein